MTTIRLTLELPGRDPLQVAAGAVVEIDDEQATALSFPVPGSRVVVDGTDVSTAGTGARVRGGLVVLGHVEVSPDDLLTDHLVALSRNPAVDPMALLADAPLLGGRPGARAGWLSGGERQVLGWLRTLVLGPTVVVLDGAGRGLDQPTLVWARAHVTAWRAAGVAVLVRVGREEEQDWLRDPAAEPSD